MLHAQNPIVKELLFHGNFGLEKESLRVDENGRFAHTPHPFPGDPNIVRDFCENQTEINTGIHPTPQEAVDELTYHYERIQRALRELPQRELLWPFSNPPYIENEADIPIAQFYGEEAGKTEYRKYLSDRYGRYKMTLSGIHFNYSFADELLEADYQVACEEAEAAGEEKPDFRAYKDMLYLVLAESAVAYGWLMVAVCAASPLMDSSYFEKRTYDKDVFVGMGSVRCSELGYWNFFGPVYNYKSLDTYVDSIQHYVDQGWLRQPSELYYPVRLKPRGVNDLAKLKSNGVSHIELRMIDLNPFVPCGIDVRDVHFAQLLLIWLASTPRQEFSDVAQVQAIQNFKNAAYYDLKTTSIVAPTGKVFSVADAAILIIGKMQEFFADASQDVLDNLEFQMSKFTDQQNRYSWQVRQAYSDTFVKKGLELAKQLQDEID